MKRTVVSLCLLGIITLSGRLAGQTINGVDDLARRSDLVAEATIQSISELVTAPDGVTASAQIVLSITSVLKGSREVKQAVVTLRRGPLRNAELKRGQRYIVFLLQSEADARRPLADDPPRYTTFTGYVGPFRMDGDKVRVIFGENGGVFKTYEGARRAQVVDEIRRTVGPIQLSGRIAVEGGTFPPPGSTVTIRDGNPGLSVPSSERRFSLHTVRRVALRVSLTPVNNEPDRSNTPSRRVVAMSVPADDRLNLVRRSAASGVPPDARFGVIDSSGAFTLGLDRSLYRVNVEGLPFGYSVKSITYGSADLVKGLLSVEGAAALELRVTLTPDGAAATGVRVSGRITGIAAEIPRDRTWVTLVSSGEMRGGAARMSADGDFEFLHVPAGTYELTTVVEPPWPVGLAWDYASTTSITVSNRDMQVNFPFFPGVEVLVRFVDRSGNEVNNVRNLPARIIFDSVSTAREPLKVTPAKRFNLYPADCVADRPHPDSCAVLNGAARVWLPRGEYKLSVLPFEAGATRAQAKSITSGLTDLNSQTLKIDETSSVDPIVITMD